MKTVLINNMTCKLGENALENWKLLSKANSKDVFFHLSSFPSGYVILECNGDVDTTTLRKVAEICKAGTKYRNLKDLNVDYCLCSNVTRGNKVGEAIYKSRRKVKQIKV